MKNSDRYYMVGIRNNFKSLSKDYVCGHRHKNINTSIACFDKQSNYIKGRKKFSGYEAQIFEIKNKRLRRVFPD